MYVENGRNNTERIPAELHFSRLLSLFPGSEWLQLLNGDKTCLSSSCMRVCVCV